MNREALLAQLIAIEAQIEALKVALSEDDEETDAAPTRCPQCKEGELQRFGTIGSSDGRFCACGYIEQGGREGA